MEIGIQQEEIEKRIILNQYYEYDYFGGIVNKFLAFILILFPCLSFGQELTYESLYQRFNMRTIYSSYGQRLKWYCESYPVEFFNEKHILSDGMVLISGDDIWGFRIIDGATVFIENKIKNSTYDTTNQYSIHYDKDHEEWRASETLIHIDSECEHFQ